MIMKIKHETIKNLLYQIKNKLKRSFSLKAKDVTELPLQKEI